MDPLLIVRLFNAVGGRSAAASGDSRETHLCFDTAVLISPSVVEIERLLHACENELDWLDLAINFKKILLCAYRPSL